MEKNTIKFTTNESGDFAILQYKDFTRMGHQIEDNDWMDFLKHLGYTVEHEEISDEEMERIS